MGEPKNTNEFVVRVPRTERQKKYSLMKFNGSLGVNVENWLLEGTSVHMERQDNSKQFELPDLNQEFGAGTEYGKAARAEARRKKMGRQIRLYQIDKQPWLLNVQGSEARNYRGMREGGAGEFSDFWVFTKNGEGVFDAYKVDDWYHFLPLAKHSTLDADTAEEEFSRRDKVLNQFALRAQLKKHMKEENDDDEAPTTSVAAKGGGKKSFKISDRDDYPSDSDSGKDSDKGEAEETQTVANKKGAKGKKKGKKGKAKKKKGDDEDNDFAHVDSDDGDEEGREQDYISDSGSDSEPEVVAEDEVVEKALVGVGDESGLRGIILSDDEDEEEEEEDELQKAVNNSQSSANTTDTRTEEDEKDSDSGSDSDDPDKQEIKSALFLQKKADGSEGPGPSGGTKRSAEQSAEEPGAKRPKTEGHQHHHDKGLSEESVRRYLERKPHTTKELVAKFKPRCEGMSKQEIVTKLAVILKRIDPVQERKKKGSKEMLYFSLPT